MDFFNCEIVPSPPRTEYASRSNQQFSDNYASQVTIDEGELEPENPQRGKRRAPESGLSPRSKDKTRKEDHQQEMDSDVSPNNSKYREIQNRTTGQVEMDRPTTGSAPRNATADQAFPAITNKQRKERYSFIVKSAREIDLQKLVFAVGKLLPDSVIIRHALSRNRKVGFFKTINESASNPSPDLNRLLKPDIQKELQKYYIDETIKIAHYDPTRKFNDTENENHVIMKNVPTEYSSDDLLELIGTNCPDFTSKITSCTRIISGQTGQQTSLVRIVCEDRDTAQLLLSQGIKIGPIIFRCEKPHPRLETRRCFRCQELNHMSHSCKNTEKCAKCGAQHRTRDCTKNREEWRCPQCGERHPVWSAKCRTNMAALQALKEKEEKRSTEPTETATRTDLTVWSQAVKRNQDKTQEVVQQKLEAIEETLHKELNVLRVELNGRIDLITQALLQFTDASKQQFESVPEEIYYDDSANQNRPRDFEKELEAINLKFSEETKKIVTLVQQNMEHLEEYTKSYEVELDKLNKTILKTEKLTENLSVQQQINNDMFTSLPSKIHETCLELVEKIGKKTKSTSLARKRQTSLIHFQSPSQLQLTTSIGSIQS